MVRHYRQAPRERRIARFCVAQWTKNDRLLLVGLLPLFVLCFSLHVREVLRTGLAQPPVFAIPGSGSDAYPTVGGLRLERGIDWNDLRVGDGLIRVGDVDLRGVGYASFDAIALEQAGLGLVVPLIFERGGERRELQLRMSQYAQPWFRVPFLLSFVLVGLLILLRAPGSRQAQAVFAAAVKSRKDSADQYDEAERPELAAKERAEIALIEIYLPAQLSDDETRALVAAKVAELELTAKSQLGQLMKAVMAEHRGEVDGKAVQRLAAELLD
jgi:hypothetical protein